MVGTGMLFSLFFGRSECVNNIEAYYAFQLAE